jgi:hypothetical protein
MTAEEVGEGICKLEQWDPKLTYDVLDPRTFAEEGGPLIAERLNAKLIAKHLVPFRKADNNKRVPRTGSKDAKGPISGWHQMRQRLLGVDDKPLLYFFHTCVAPIRTIRSCSTIRSYSRTSTPIRLPPAADETRYVHVAALDEAAQGPRPGRGRSGLPGPGRGRRRRQAQFPIL